MEKGSEYMSHSTVYRICLLVVVILTIIGGIFYYVNYMESQVRVTEGTLVMEDAQEGQQAIPAYKNEQQNSIFACGDEMHKKAVA